MEASVATFSQRLCKPWLTCEVTQARIANAFARLTEALQKIPQETLLVIAPDETEQILAAVLAALATGHPAVLGNPQWAPAEALAARDLLGGQQAWLTSRSDIDSLTSATRTAAIGYSSAATPPLPVQAAPLGVATPMGTIPTGSEALAEQLYLQYISAPSPRLPQPDALAGYLLVPTGGTGGSLKLAYHNWQTLYAAIAGYARFWETDALNCVCSLPVFHIGGLMPALRTFATAGRLCLLPWRQLQALAAADSPLARSTTTETAAPLPNVHALARNWQISLVPAQVQQLLGNAAASAWLCNMQAVLIGGGATRSDLLEAAAAAAIPLCPAYGMTETAATIALQRPADFLRTTQRHEASPPAGEVLPHLNASIEAESGRILLSGASLFHGYFPAQPHATPSYATSDRGQLAEESPQQEEANVAHTTHMPPRRRQLLTVLGRLDNIIVSGGKKIDPALVEQAITAEARRQGYHISGLLVTAVADERWGQRLIVFIETAAIAKAETPKKCPPPADSAMIEALRNGIRNHLPAYQIPKQWLCVTTLPLNERGKPDRQRIAELGRVDKI